MSTESRRVAITGIGVVSAYGFGKDPFWAGLLSARQPASLSEANTESIRCKVIRAPAVLAHELLPNLQPPYPSRYSSLLLVATKLAIADANLPIAPGNLRNVGTVISTDFGPNENVERYLTDLLLKGPRAASPMLFSRTVANVGVGDLARYFQFQGPSTLVIGENPVCYAYDLISDGRADAIICGGVDELREVIMRPYTESGVASAETASNDQPYSELAVGMTLGEGAAVAVLERLDLARARSATIYAEVVGYASICDREANFELSNRSYKDIGRAMLRAIELGGASPTDVGLVFGCASSHPGIGRSELDAVRSIWQGSKIKLTSVKGALGETFGASGLMTVSAGALSLFKREIPPSGPLPITQIPGVDVVCQMAIPTDAKMCLCNSIHIGGNDTSILLKAA